MLQAIKQGVILIIQFSCLKMINVSLLLLYIVLMPQYDQRLFTTNIKK